MSTKKAIELRAKKLGVLIKDARLTAGKSKKEVAEAIAATTYYINSYEMGRKSPSFPELQVLAFFLGIPLSHFWSDQIKSDDPSPNENLEINTLYDLRNQLISGRLQQARADHKLGYKKLSELSGISISRIKKYEKGEEPVPLPELESLLKVFKLTLNELLDPQYKVEKWILQENAAQDFKQLPLDMQEFVIKPVNLPYLEIARRLSEMSVDKLRDVAEGLLDITL